MIQLIGNHISKAENLVMNSEGDQVVHPHTTIPLEIRPPDWLNPRILPNLQADQLSLIAQYRETHPIEEGQEEGYLADQCNAHGDVCRTLADSFKAQREAMNQSLLRPTASGRTAPPTQAGSLAGLVRAMHVGDGFVDPPFQQQVRQQQQTLLLQQYQQLYASSAKATASIQAMGAQNLPSGMTPSSGPNAAGTVVLATSAPSQHPITMTGGVSTQQVQLS